MSQLNGPARFRQLLAKPGYIQALGVYDPLSARVCESMGVECVHIGGYQAGVGTAISEPLMTLTELAMLCHYVTSAVKIPVFVDAGTGFGEPLHVMRSVRELERTGIAGMHIEDQIFPKRAHYHKYVEHTVSVEEMVAAARKFGHERLPLYDESPDTIVGILNCRALLLDPNGDLADAIEFPSFVPESMNLLQLLSALQRQRRGLAIVMDEFGSTAGLVTMEDIIEAIVGEIRSEGEAPGFVMEQLASGRWRVNGTMRVEDFRREYPELGGVSGVDTMGGLLVALKEVVPQPGESVVFGGVRLTAHAADERRVREVLVERVKGGARFCGRCSSRCCCCAWRCRSSCPAWRSACLR